MRPALCTLLLIVGAGTGMSAPGAAMDRHPWADAIEAKSRSFIVETNTFPELARSLVETLQASYTFYEDRFGALEGPARRPMRVALFRTEAEYMGAGGGVEGAIGHFDSALDRCAFVWRGEAGEQGWPIAAHEACHHYFRRRFPTLATPSWYSEGIACYFEGLRDPTTVRSISRVRVRAAKAAFEAGDAKLDLLLATRAQVRNGRLQLHNFAPSRFYALAWSFCHFLATDVAMRDSFRRFELRLLASRPSAAARESHARALLIEECGPLSLLETRWQNHLAGLPMPVEPVAVPVYAWELSAENPFVRYVALQRLGEADLDGALRAAALPLLGDRDLVVRTAATRLFASRMGADAVPALIVNLDRGDEALKALALSGLAHPEAGAAVARLLLEEEDRAEALEALSVIRTEAALPALRAALADLDLPARVRSRCAAALREDPGAAPLLALAAKDSDRGVRTAARAALLSLGHDPDEFAESAHERRRAAAQAAADALEQLELLRRMASADGQARELPDLLAVLREQSASAEAKARACHLLGTMGADEAVPLLRRACRALEADSVRFAAARALVRITGETRGFVEGQTASERERALQALAE